MTHLEDSGLQRGNGREDAVVPRINAIEAETQTTHIHLTFWEMLNTRRIIHVAQDLMTESGLKFLAAGIKLCELFS